MRPRAGVILIEDGRVALIRRRRGSLLYYVFPGGGVDRGESFEEAARREAHEELGVEVELIPDPTVRMRTPSEHRYWRARIVGGTFGQAKGTEFTRRGGWNGSYEPVWMPLEELAAVRVIPRALSGFIVRSEQDGWPKTDVTLIEWAWLERGPEQRSADPFASETTTVVTAEVEDVPAWLDLAREVEELFGAEMSRDPDFRAILEKHVTRGTAFVARENWGAPGTPLAGAMLWRPRARAIGWLAVAERWRRRGIGSALVEHVLAAHGTHPVSVVTFAETVEGGEAARLFYRRHGFEPVTDEELLSEPDRQVLRRSDGPSRPPGA